MADQLKVGDSFPEYRVRAVGDRELQLPGDLRGTYSVLLFYRGVGDRTAIGSWPIFSRVWKNSKTRT
jgi:hypothetical protein